MSLLLPELIAQLRCPETQQPLTLADEAGLARVIECSTARDFEGALIREDGLRAYPIRDGFPILLISEAIAIGSVES